MKKAKEIIKKLEQELLQVADQVRAKDQQRYMKSQMPYFGVSLPEVKKISNVIFKNFAPENNEEYRDILLYLFEHAKQREIWYAAMVYASKHKMFVLEENIDIYMKIVRITGWWDVIDLFAANVIGKVLFGHKDIHIFLKKWISDDDLWVRRTALLAQLKYKDKTDFELQKKLILIVAHEKEFFIRKAIGWSLREYSKTNPDAVRLFIENNEERLSSLSIREGLRVINKG